MAWLKRMSAPKIWPIERKTSRFAPASRGPNIKGLPLAIFVRDMLKLADSGVESRSIIKQKKIFVNGKAVSDPKYGLGLLDVVSIPSASKNYRIFIKDRYTFSEITEEDAKVKICGILDKKTVRGKKMQLNLTGGINILADKDYKTGGSVVLELPGYKIKDYFPFEEGSIALITLGKRAGELSKISKIEKEHRRVWVHIGDEDIEVPMKAVLIVGKESPVINFE